MELLMKLRHMPMLYPLTKSKSIIRKANPRPLVPFLLIPPAMQTIVLNIPTALLATPKLTVAVVIQALSETGILMKIREQQRTIQAAMQTRQRSVDLRLPQASKVRDLILMLGAMW